MSAASQDFDDDVVEFVTEELVDNTLVFTVDFEEVGEGANSGHAVGVVLVGVSLEDVADGVGGVAVLSDQGFEGAAAAVETGDFATELIAAALCLSTLLRDGLRFAREGRRFRIRDV